ncbi:MAG: hypothetical protein KME08_15175 [Aphanothece sp. CMT-3BRIN-NPC111]|jgi:hypothetical protein|nr:hypothetical protein [Aphanothece sp. CMT-3BRIN-NPC111]
MPQAALSFVHSSVTSQVKATSDLVAASSLETEIRQKFQNQFICLNTKEFNAQELTESRTRQEVRNLAEALRSCFNQNSNRVGFVDFNNLIGVIYTTEVRGNSAVIVVGLGRTGNPISTVAKIPGSTGGAPLNGINVVITNASEIDGNPYTIGQNISLKAEARDEKGKDISSGMVWQNIDNQTIGSGSTLNYHLDQVKNETIKAKVKVPDGRENWDIVSFTVSSSDTKIAPGVKVPHNKTGLQSNKHIYDVNLQQGFICIKDDESLPKLKLNDVFVPWFGPDLGVDAPARLVEGVEQALPPMKLGSIIPTASVLGATAPKDAICFQAEIVSELTDIIEKGDKNFDSNGEIDLTKYDVISPVQCSDPDADPRLCSSVNDPKQVVGFRPIQPGWSNVNNKPLDELLKGINLPNPCKNLDLVQNSTPNLMAAKDTILLPPKRRAQKVISQKSNYKVAQEVIRNPLPEPFPPYNCQLKPDLGDLSWTPELTIPTKRYEITLLNVNERKGNLWHKGDNSDYQSNRINGKEPNPKTQQSAARTGQEYRIHSKGFVAYEFKPRMSGKISFNKPLQKTLSGVALTIDGGARARLVGGVTLDALYRLGYKNQWTLFKIDSSAPRIAFSIGPVPVWIAVYFQVPLQLNSGLSMCYTDGIVGFEFGAEGNFKVTYDPVVGIWKGERPGFKSYIRPLSGGQASVEGRAVVSVIPRLQFLVYDAAGPALSLQADAVAGTRQVPTTVNIVNPATETYNHSQDQELNLEAKITKGNVAPAIDFGIGTFINIEMFSVNELIFPPIEKEIIPGLCVKTPKICDPTGFLGCTGGKTYCTKPVKISFDISGWFKKNTSISPFQWPDGYKGYTDDLARPVNGSPRKIGSIDLPDIPLGCPRLVWETNDPGDLQYLGFQAANTQLRSRELRAPACSLPPKTYSVTASAYSPFAVDFKPENRLGSDTVTVNIQASSTCQ